MNNKVMIGIAVALVALVIYSYWKGKQNEKK